MPVTIESTMGLAETTDDTPYDFQAQVNNNWERLKNHDHSSGWGVPVKRADTLVVTNGIQINTGNLYLAAGLIQDATTGHTLGYNTSTTRWELSDHLYITGQLTATSGAVITGGLSTFSAGVAVTGGQFLVGLSSYTSTTKAVIQSLTSDATSTALLLLNQGGGTLLSARGDAQLNWTGQLVHNSASNSPGAPIALEQALGAKINLYDAGSGSYYGMGINGGEMYLSILTGGVLGVRTNSGSGAQVVKVDWNGNLTITGVFSWPYTANGVGISNANAPFQYTSGSITLPSAALGSRLCGYKAWGGAITIFAQAGQGLYCTGAYGTNNLQSTGYVIENGDTAIIFSDGYNNWWVVAPAGKNIIGGLQGWVDNSMGVNQSGHGLYTLPDTLAADSAFSGAVRAGPYLTDTTSYAFVTAQNVANPNGRGVANQWATFSSRAFKANVRHLADPLELLKHPKLRGVRYQHALTEGQPEQIGFIAEELAEVLPEVVDLDAEGNPVAIAYGPVAALLAEALKELLGRVEALEVKAAT